jgi:hypothetical protein
LSDFFWKKLSANRLGDIFQKKMRLAPKNIATLRGLDKNEIITSPSGVEQGCQMVYFQTQNTKLGKF